MEEEVIITNKFKTTRGSLASHKSYKESEDDDNLIEDIEEDNETGKYTRTEKKETSGEASVPRRKRRVHQEKTNFFQPALNFFKDQRLHKIIGLALILLSVYLLIAFTSFLFTWKTDQDKVMGSWWKLFFTYNETDPFAGQTEVENWLGKFGAVISHLFIHKGLGVASYFFVIFSFLAGCRILFKISLFPLRKFFKRAFFMLFWVSVTLGYLFQNDYFFLGGTFGFQTSLWLNKTLGTIGTGFLLVFSFFGFLAVAFNYSFDWLRNKQAEQEMEKLDTIDKTEPLPTENIPVEVVTVQKENKNEFEMIPETEKKEKETKQDENGNVPFTVAQTQQEAMKTEESEEDLSTFGDFDPTLELPDYQRPPIDLLKDYGNNEANVDREELVANSDKIIATLRNFGIGIKKITATVGPTVTLYEIIPVEGVRIATIKNLENDIALSLAALGIRIIAPMPGKGTIGIEVPNKNPEIVSIRSIIASEKFQNTNLELPFGLGKTIANETYIADLTKMPHLLIAGATGQGKSVGLNTILTSLLYKKHPAQVKFVLIDPKRVELTLFNKIERHFLAKIPNTTEAIITDTTQVIHTLQSLCIEMDERLNLLSMAEVRDIKQYNAKFIDRKLNPKKGHKYLPYIVVVIDEFGDLIMQAGKEIETPLTRLAQVARATGIHLIIATQRPSVNIITGTIKANFPARIAFRVQSMVDSKTILDTKGAEQLVGRGDMLVSVGGDLIRLQCPFVDISEVEKITEFIGSQKGYPEAFKLPEYIDEESDNLDNLDPTERDEFFEDSARIVVAHQQASASLLQRKLKLGYNRAGRIIDQLEAAGIIGPFKGSKAREVLIKDPVSLEQLLSKTKENENDISNENNPI